MYGLGSSNGSPVSGIVRISEVSETDVDDFEVCKQNHFLQYLGCDAMFLIFRVWYFFFNMAVASN